MREIVINICWGGFGISQQAVEWLRSENVSEEELEEINRGWPTAKARMHPKLIECVRTLGKEADGMNSKLHIVTFEGNKIRIEDYDGMEAIRTPYTERYETV